MVKKHAEPRFKPAIVRFYQFSVSAFQIIKKLEYSDQEELEVADLINKIVLQRVCTFINSRSISDSCIDNGSNESLVHATNFERKLKKNSDISIV